jgi:hypothetical protein
MLRKVALTGAVIILPTAIVVAALSLLRSESPYWTPSRAPGSGHAPALVTRDEPARRTRSHGFSRRAEPIDRDEISGRVAALVRAACSRNASAREEAIATLVEMGDVAVPHLARMLGEARPPRELKAVAEILVRIGTPSALAVIEDALDPGVEENLRAIVASAVVDAAGDGADGSVRDLMRDDPRLAWRVHAGRRWGRADHEGAISEWVSGYYRAESELERSEYLDALGAARNPESIPELEHVVRQNPDDEVVAGAARSLARIGTERTVGVLVDELRRFAGTDRGELLEEALGNVKSRELLEAYLDDESEAVRDAVSEILDESGDHDEAGTDGEQDDGPDKDDDDTDDGTGSETGGGPAISPFD